jgi:2-polyprenyl-3-methyl-5-hydroxy-6-metoxy-1,4-benzoquinol methylase
MYSKNIIPKENIVSTEEIRTLETQSEAKKKIVDSLIYIDPLSEISLINKFFQSHFNEEANNKYEKNAEKIAYFPVFFDEICQKYNFSGTVIDIGCGTGIGGKIILKHNNSSKIIGVDFAEEMAKKSIQNGYQNVYVGLMEEIIPVLVSKNVKFDHAISLSAIYHLPNNVVTNFLSSLFEIAEKSVTLEIEEITEEFLVNIERKLNFRVPFFNNVPIVEEFRLPNN